MIVVCGEALVDFVPSGDGIQRPTAGGWPFNTARALARLRVPTAFLGRLSTGAFGHQLGDLLGADGADLSQAHVGSVPTTLGVGEVDSDGLAAYGFVINGPNLTPAMVPPSLSPDVNALHVGTLGLVLEPMASTLAGFIQRGSEQRVVKLDLNIRPALVANAGQSRRRLDAVIARRTIVKGRDADLAWLYPDLDLEAAVDRILGAGVRKVVATLGAQAALGASNSVHVRVPAPTVEVVGTIGAGDFLGVALLAWLPDHGALGTDVVLGVDELKSAQVFACLVASLTCTRAGAEPPWRAELGDDLAGSLGTSDK